MAPTRRFRPCRSGTEDGWVHVRFVSHHAIDPWLLLAKLEKQSGSRREPQLRRCRTSKTHICMSIPSFQRGGPRKKDIGVLLVSAHLESTSQRAASN
jgi:hypothetical protein